MTRTIEDRLYSLRRRRKGADRLSVLAGDSVSLEKFTEKLDVPESWEARAVTKPNTQYALGAMQEVDADYTRISKETAERVAKQLGKKIGGFDLEFLLQGSVSLNVHIRGVSDVDLLTLIDKQFWTYDSTGVKAIAGAYHSSATTNTSLQQLTRLRNEEEPALKNAFPSAMVDTSGGKAIKISGGSLARSVDVVPCHWYDSAEYQQSGAIHDRGVIILDRKANQTVTNYPFRHIERVSSRDNLVLGSLKKAIRLCKNVKADSERDIALSSFDIAGLMYHADQAALRQGATYELAILAEVQRFLDYLYNHPSEAKRLFVPDGTRVILDTPAKVSALLSLSVEMDELLKVVALEQNPLLGVSGIGEARQRVANVQIL